MFNNNLHRETARTHDEACAALCCVCWRKVKSGGRKVSNNLTLLVRQFVFDGYSPNNNSHPTSICNNCRVALSMKKKVMLIRLCVIKILNPKLKDPNGPKSKLPPRPDYENLVPPPPKTRSSTDSYCSCTICVIARMKNQEYVQYHQEHSNPVGNPVDTTHSPPARKIPVCNKCFSLFGPGQNHVCSKSTFQSNISHLVKNRSAKSKEKVTSKILKNLAAEQGVSLRGGQVNLQSGSNIIPVKIGTPKVVPKPRRFSHEDFKKIQATHNLSDKATK